MGAVHQVEERRTVIKVHPGHQPPAPKDREIRTSVGPRLTPLEGGPEGVLDDLVQGPP